MAMGTIKQVVIGPASILSILTLQFTRDLPIEFVHLLTFFTGCVQLAMAALRLGELGLLARLRLPRGKGLSINHVTQSRIPCYAAISQHACSEIAAYQGMRTTIME